MEKLYFNTGVRPENRINSNGRISELCKHQEWRGGVLQCAFYVSDIPENGRFEFAIPPSSLQGILETHKKPYWEYREILDGEAGIFPGYAFFKVYPVNEAGQ